MLSSHYKPFSGHCASFGYIQSPTPENEWQSASVKVPVLHASGQQRLKFLPYCKHHMPFSFATACHLLFHLLAIHIICMSTSFRLRLPFYLLINSFSANSLFPLLPNFHVLFHLHAISMRSLNDSHAILRNLDTSMM